MRYVLLMSTSLIACQTTHESGSAPAPSATAIASAIAPQTAETKPIVVTAKQLHADYKSNEVAADEKYKDKSLIVTGKIESIDKDAFGNMVVRIATDNDFESAMATLRDTEKAHATKLTKGALVAVRCKGAGMVIGSPTLSDCVLPDMPDAGHR